MKTRTAVCMIICLLAHCAYALDVATENRDSYYHFLQGLIYQRNGYLKEAKIEFEKTVQLDPDAISAYKELILSYLSLQDIDNAVTYAEELNNRVQDSIEIQLFLGGFYLVIKDAANALEAYNKVLEKEPNNSEAIVSLATVYYELEPEKSIFFWDKYIDENPDSSDAYYNKALTMIRLDRKEEARALLEQSVALDQENIAPLLTLAQLYENEKDYKNALKQYKNYIDLDPENLLLLIKTGSLYYTTQQFSEAEEVFKTILRLYPQEASAYLWLSLLAEEKKDWELAADYLQKSLVAEEGMTSYTRLSYYYTQMGEYKKAIKALKRAITISPESPEPYFFLALGYMDMKKLRKAEKFFLKAIQLKPDLPEAYFYLGVILEQTKRFNKSIPFFRKAIELNPQNATAYNYLGYSLVDRDLNLKEAEELITTALSLDPGNGAFLDSLGWLYFKQGNIHAARRELMRAIEKHKDPVILEHLGDVNSQMGNTNEAKDYYQKALILNPNNKSLKKKLDALHTQ